jgi:NADH-quinone oxidoreductase subunit C
MDDSTIGSIDMIQKYVHLIQEHFGNEVILQVDVEGLQPAMWIQPQRMVDVCLFLRDHQDTYFDFLSSISAVDDGVSIHPFYLVYHLSSLPFQRQLVLKVRPMGDRNLDRLPEVQSVSRVWRAADWHEREAFDLMGIYFEGHPDLRRILLPEDWQGFPLRKDYQEEAYYHEIPTSSLSDKGSQI